MRLRKRRKTPTTIKRCKAENSNRARNSMFRVVKLSQLLRDSCWFTLHIYQVKSSFSSFKSYSFIIIIIYFKNLMPYFRNASTY